jgi:hypothetical protein
MRIAREIESLGEETQVTFPELLSKLEKLIG